ncbi:MAG: bifunctional phosphoribosylaminoimidazolecarboxamide formyltransferase/IMP cyclohydrolase [Sporocytophaga sp.]|nr:bifunctional phosphoribosylaminoimidazolecarboxamide formyltransferase/IMP cyclohydrolase [Sporocytophaga sp.]
MNPRKIKSALISVYYKDGLDRIVKLLDKQGVKIYSTGGTQKFIEDLGIKVTPVEELTTYPSILGGRVKTLHPKIFGGILFRRDFEQDQKEVAQYDIPSLDLVIVDLYPFEETVASGASDEDIIEKIDIGGISLIRGAAKNFKDVVIVASKDQYPMLENILVERKGETDLNERRLFAGRAFDISSHYDTAIFNYFFSGEEIKHFKQSVRDFQVLRYGENPHQAGVFYGKLDDMFEKLNGKELSYNNLLDIDAAVGLIDEFEGATTFAILKHNNACGIATAATPKEAYLKALAADPVSAFGGVIITGSKIDLATAEELNKLFFEVLIAPDFEKDALELLTSKKNRILLRRKSVTLPSRQFKTLLNGVIEQEKDLKKETEEELKPVTNRFPSDKEKRALLFANKICKHTKSNAIVLAVDGQMISSGVGQTSRVDALRQAIEKAKSFGFSLEGAVMASDAFFPFPDCVEIADKAGIKAVIQPGGSIKDQESIDYCNAHEIAMVLTGFRHFKH